MSELLLTNRKRLRFLDNAARLADNYSLTHKDSFVGKPHKSTSFTLKFTTAGSTGNSGKDDSRKD